MEQKFVMLGMCDIAEKHVKYFNLKLIRALDVIKALLCLMVHTGT
jgi:hypothetical protein